ncbi:MAG: phosphoglycerate kinase [Parcubacteria group bacterium]|nr:phosphoglycerate kinase [Parcubacteria group bacterium]
MKSIQQAQVLNTRVLVRCDFNVPLDEQGNILDDLRIVSALRTIRYLVQEGAKVILISHLDRPAGKVVERFRLNSVRSQLASLLGIPVNKADDCVGKDVENAILAIKPGDVLLLENLRFHEGEEKNSPEFAKQLARLGDQYVNEAFSASHRAHASIDQLPSLIPSFAGLALLEEVRALEPLLKNPAKPMVVIVGGTKVETKADFLDTISEAADALLVSNLIARELELKNIRFKNMQKVVKPVDGNPGNGLNFDIGPGTIALFCEMLKDAKTVFWSGPVGRVEEEEYKKGSLALAQAVIASHAYSVAGGGNLNAFLRKQGLQDKFSHVSTGGGALLAFLAGDRLPGLAALGYYDGN